MAQPLLTTLFQLYLIIQWILLSSTIILFNKWILSSANFHYPLSLVLMHMAFVTVCSQVHSPGERRAATSHKFLTEGGRSV